MAMVTLTEAKKQLLIDDDDTTHDDVIQGYCDGITAAIEEYKNEVIEQREIHEDVERYTRRGHCFRLWRVPVISLTSVTSLLTGQTWDVAALRPDLNSGLVRVLSGPPVCGLVEVVYQAGYATVPENYKQGALVVLQHVWETRRGVGPAEPSEVIGEEERRWDPRFAYTIPRKALEWLGKPRPVNA